MSLVSLVPSSLVALHFSVKSKYPNYLMYTQNFITMLARLNKQAKETQGLSCWVEVGGKGSCLL